MSPTPLLDDLDEAFDLSAPFTDDEITELLFPTIDPTTKQPVPPSPSLVERAARFRIETVDHLDWAGRKILRKAGRLAEIDQHVATQTAALKAWAVQARKEPAGTIAWLESLVIDHANLTRQATNGATKTVSAPSVTVSGMLRTPTVEITDPKVFADWARECAPDAVEDQDPKLYKSKLGKVAIVEDGSGHLVVYNAAGDQIPGVRGVDPENGPKIRTVEIAKAKPAGEGFDVRTEFVSYTVKPTPLPGAVGLERELAAAPDPE